MYSKQIFAIWTRFGFISVFRLTALLKLEITVCFLWLSFPVHSGSLERIYYLKLYSQTHTLSFECFDCSLRISLLYFLSVYKFKKIMGRTDFSFQFRKIIIRRKGIGYDLNAIR